MAFRTLGDTNCEIGRVSVRVNRRILTGEINKTLNTRVGGTVRQVTRRTEFRLLAWDTSWRVS